MRLLGGLVALALVAGAAGWWFTAPPPVPASYAALTGNPEAGRLAFAAAGCASCHTDPEAEPSDSPVLSGGQRFASDFGTFIAPNISPSPEGVGAWSDAELIHAVRAGVSPSGAHLYPAFPYAAYNKALPQDVADLVAYLRTLPPSEVESLPHEVGFPFNLRRGLGLWKALFLSDDYVLAEAELDSPVDRGRYLVEALGHCGECHTPRNPLGALDTSRWLGGAPHPSGEGTIPNITPAGLSWSEAEIAEYLKSGFTPDFDTAGGEMAEVVATISQLSDDDRLAIAAYLKAVPEVAPD
ncbi:Diheme class I cytochrome c [Oceanicola granulosus HTCC2516]|uniref:Diheme class I cytochrome c n=1 Tax=Oceanicola granulosus (strain ATCC BAA-861 / DSM 15982 / KCTC 12143 / HTCC2516) TaxID=314256 RepID=Q2CEI2_OCEGH|nr:cytochrome c [Oceanicola granulosus]EAR51015.1 Diheme class I cytochrome c [Oceanicola granulosus HTCC2516]